MRLVALVVALAFSPLAFAQSVAGGFTLETVVNPVASGRAMAFAPDGRLFYTENGSGRIMVVDNAMSSPGTPAAFATVSGFVAPGGNDLGLHGIALHPAFPASPTESANRYVYACHATGTPGAPQLVIKRFTEDISNLGTALPGSETSLFSSIDMGSAGGNFGGRIAFGPDGLLYVSVGDGGSAVSLAGGFAQNVNDRRGKILRYQSDGGIPLNNPVGGNPMFARGLRNPRGIAFNPSTADGFCADRGNPLTGGTDELNLLIATGNYGWDGAGNSGNQNNPAYNNPAWLLADTFEPAGVAFYPENGTAFPAAGYRSGAAYVSSEPATGSILRVVLSGGNERVGVAAWPLASAFSSGVRDLRFGADGNLYALTDGVLHRIRYTGNTSPNNPVANAGTDQQVNEGATVNLNGANSFDADVSDVLRFTWRQVGGGTLVTLNNPTTATPSFVAPQVAFTQGFTFELIVEDGNGGVHSAAVIVTVRNIGSPSGPRPAPLEAPGEGGCAVGARGSWPAALFLLLAPLLMRTARGRSRDQRRTSARHWKV